jgi:hypothetical protein
VGPTERANVGVGAGGVGGAGGAELPPPPPQPPSIDDTKTDAPIRDSRRPHMHPASNLVVLSPRPVNYSNSRGRQF